MNTALYIMMALGLILLFSSLIKLLMDISLKKWNFEEQMWVRVKEVAKFCYNRPIKKVSKKARARKLASQRRLESLWAKDHYFLGK